MLVDYRRVIFVAESPSLNYSNIYSGHIIIMTTYHCFDIIMRPVALLFSVRIMVGSWSGSASHAFLDLYMVVLAFQTPILAWLMIGGVFLGIGYLHLFCLNVAI